MTSILVVDVGNSDTSIAQIQGGTVVRHERTPTDRGWTGDAFAARLLELFGPASLVEHAITGGAIASVVASVTDAVAQGCSLWSGAAPLVVDDFSALPMTLDVEQPGSVGIDRLLNAAAAVAIFKSDVIVVDFGTATTLDCATADSTFLGGVIAPGIALGAQALATRSARLPVPPLVVPSQTIGKTTEQCLQSGLLLGAVEAVDGLVRRIRAEWPTSRPPIVVATGGLAGIVVGASSTIQHHLPHLTLIGLAAVFTSRSAPPGAPRDV